jgi:hypothetical protein
MMATNKERDPVAEMISRMIDERLESEMGSRVGAMQELFQSIDTSLSSLVEATEASSGKAMAAALADALGAAFAKIKVPQAPPAAQLPAPNVDLRPEFKFEPKFTVPPAPQPTVVMPSQNAAFHVEFKYGNGGRLTDMFVTRKAVD